jgi:hypothetical protein
MRPAAHPAKTIPVTVDFFVLPAILLAMRPAERVNDMVCLCRRLSLAFGILL